MITLSRLIYWIQEREKIRLRKAAGEPKPWTQDPILRTYRFCNIRRMDDKVSQWLLHNWYTPHFGHKNMLVAAAMARNFNLPSTLEVIGFPLHWRPKQIKARLIKLKKKQTIFNGAYMVRGMSRREPNFTAIKSDQIIDRVCQPLFDNPPELDTSSMQRSVEALTPRWGFAPFMAGQVVADLRHALPGEWNDRNLWAPMGPGSKRGMNRLMGRHPNHPIKADQFQLELTALMEELDQAIPAITVRLEAIDVQNCLCEYDKYMRTANREGKPKQKYPGV